MTTKNKIEEAFPEVTVSEQSWDEEDSGKVIFLTLAGVGWHVYVTYMEGDAPVELYSTAFLSGVMIQPTEISSSIDGVIDYIRKAESASKN